MFIDAQRLMTHSSSSGRTGNTPAVLTGTVLVLRGRSAVTPENGGRVDMVCSVTDSDLGILKRCIRFKSARQVLRHPQSSMEPEPRCLGCGKMASEIRDQDTQDTGPSSPPPKLRLCAGCKNASFCSSECQKLAWQDHKLVCRRADRQPPGD